MASLMNMTPLRHRNALAVATILLAAGLGLIGCSSPSSTGDGAPSEPSAATDDAATGEQGCPPEMDDIVSAGGEIEIERVSPSDYFLPGVDETLLADACLYETTNQDKSAQWAWFRGDDASVVAAALAEALATAGYTLEDETGSAQLYTSASAPSVTLAATASAEEAAAQAAQPIFDLLGPYVSVFEYYS